MLTVERKKYILELLQERDYVSVTELSADFKVSEVTIRKILNELDAYGYLKRTRGGAVSLSISKGEFEEKEKEMTNVKEKKAIAKAAYDYIEEKDIIFLDAGSTTLELVRFIKNGNKRNIVIVTNAINIAYELTEVEDIDLILIGGCVRHRILSCVGGIAEKAIDSLYFDKLFLGANSVDIIHGITTPNVYEAQVKQHMLNSTKEVILITDYSKFGKASLSQICPVERINHLITDNKTPEEYISKIRDLGVKVTLTENNEQINER